MEHFEFANTESTQPAGTVKSRRPPSPDLLAFRERVLNLIQEARSEAALERSAGLPVGTISHYSRRNPHEPLRTTLVALAKGANVQLEWLCTGQGPKRRPVQLDLIPCCGINDL